MQGLTPKIERKTEYREDSVVRTISNGITKVELAKYKSGIITIHTEPILARLGVICKD